MAIVFAVYSTSLYSSHAVLLTVAILSPSLDVQGLPSVWQASVLVYSVVYWVYCHLTTSPLCCRPVFSMSVTHFQIHKLAA